MVWDAVASSCGMRDAALVDEPIITKDLTQFFQVPRKPSNIKGPWELGKDGKWRGIFGSEGMTFRTVLLGSHPNDLPRPPTMTEVEEFLQRKVELH